MEILMHDIIHKIPLTHSKKPTWILHTVKSNNEEAAEPQIEFKSLRSRENTEGYTSRTCSLNNSVPYSDEWVGIFENDVNFRLTLLPGLKHYSTIKRIGTLETRQPTCDFKVFRDVLVLDPARRPPDDNSK